jgi:DNA topoisomerase-1
MRGRYGPYVTDGATNATIPRDTDPLGVTLEQALALIAERVAKGGSKPPKKTNRTNKTKKNDTENSETTPARGKSANSGRKSRTTAKKIVSKKRKPDKAASG